MKKVLMLIMVLCLGLLVVGTKAEVFFEAWDGVPPTDAGGQPLLSLQDWSTIGPAAETAILPNISVGPRAGTDKFITRCTAYVLVPATAQYSFWVDSDDGGIVFIDGVEVATWDGWHGANGVGVTNGPVTLTAGLHLIEAQQYEDGGGDSITVYVESADIGLEKTQIPDNLLWASPAAKVDPTNIIYPDQALATNPAHTAIDVAIAGTVLEWTNPLGATSFDLYFGDSALVGDPNDDDAYFVATVTGTTADLDALYGALDNDTTYYWRVDANAEPNDVIGIMYSFDSIRMDPIITGQPESADVGPGGCVATFTVAAISGINEDGGTLTYQWKAGGVDIAGATEASYGTDVEGSYSVVVGNDFGSTVSNAAELSIRPHDIAGTGQHVGNEPLTAGEGWSEDGGVYTVSGAGRDIWDDRDDFYYVYVPITGDVDVSCRITEMQTTAPHNWHKGGIMIRDSLETGSRHAFVAMTSANGMSFQRRHETDQSSSSDHPGNDLAPFWGRLVRVGNQISGYRAPDVGGAPGAWTQIGGTQTINMDVGATDYLGLAVTSHVTGGVSTTLYDNVDFLGTDWSPQNPQYTPALDGNGWFDPNVDLAVSWDMADLGPCGATYNVIWTTDEAVANDPNAPVYATVADTTVTIAAADLSYEDEVYWRVDVSFDGTTEQGEVWYVEAVKLVPVHVTEPADVFAFGGDTVSFTFETTSDTAMVSHVWYKEAEGGDILVEDTGLDNTVTIEGVDVASDGMYYCIAENTSGPTRSASARLEIAQLIGHWEMETIVDGKLIDSVDTPMWGGHDGVLFSDANAPALAAGVIGNAIGVNIESEMLQYAVMGPVGISGAKPRSITCWAKAAVDNSLIDGWSTIFGFTSANAGTNLSFDFNRRGNGALGYCMHVYGWERDIAAVDDQWHLLAGTYDGTTIAWYHNGVFLGEDSSRNLNTDDIVQLGKRAHSDQSWRGWVDDARVYNYVLDPIQIATMYTDVMGGSVCAKRPAYDFNNDCDTDIQDFAMFMSGWMECNLYPADACDW